jgi:hypothetical protein
MRTHVVDGRGGKDFARIGDAVAAAEPGDRIIVNPGRRSGLVYEQQIVVCKSLEILGADIVKVFVRAGGSVLTWRGGDGRIINLDIRNIRNNPERHGYDDVPATASGASWAAHCLAVEGGSLLVEGCRFMSFWGGGPANTWVSVAANAEASFLNTELNGDVEASGRTTIRHCHLAGINARGPLALRRSTVYGGSGRSAMQVLIHGEAVVADNHIRGTGIEVLEGGRAEPRGNLAASIMVRDGGSVVTGNEVERICVSKESGTAELTGNQAENIYIINDGGEVVGSGNRAKSFFMGGKKPQNIRLSGNASAYWPPRYGLEWRWQGRNTPGPQR